ncbi:MAG: glutamine--fructose-6-phosphate transaminase (isomerizing) [Acetobacter sp.]|nr:glutamine--fructose-6-phosphate transaminase (isomerizing) [Bacteroides sp.]MCM1341918.1 glutamine--fructose-6-phosphate transaminase (isomerizing) [Acetobacter sp.]MCM1434102.1 glutamine--fructose-6-phosphate transaminase (isomerizing) [Clostridiales bacterium]
MCGIIGYTGFSEARNILLKGLKTLEYRGYDSTGIAVFHPDFKECLITKCEGKVENLIKKTSDVKGNSGIGHTRWATHGGVCDINSHPHKFGTVTVVHNGIIENYEALRDTLGVAHKLKSQTDSEVVAALIDRCFKNNPEDAIIEAVKKLTGTFALAIMFDSIPDTIFAVRNVSPIVCCKNDNGVYIASDIMAIGEYSTEYFVLPELTISKITKNGYSIIDFYHNDVKPKMLELNWDIKNSSKGKYPFFMEKEIMEQPQVIEKTILNRIKDGLPCFDADGVDDSVFENCTNISIIACGTAMHAGLIGKHLIESICAIPVSVNMASEYVYSNPIINSSTLVICVSQSGETIDSLEALKYAKKCRAKVLSIVNVRGSSIARESDYVIYTEAGPEIAVASTKAYTTQLAVFYLITAKLAYLKGSFNYEGVTSFIDELKKAPDAVKDVLERRSEIHHLSKSMLTADDVFMIGRGIDYPALLEASLKLKEISYIHSEAFASGELKHGTIALITHKTPVIALLTQQYLVSKQVSNIREVQSRGANVISFVRNDLATKDIDCSFMLPALDDEFMPIPSVVSLQLLAYYVSSDKGLDVDKPRNLAKVVTVE